MRRKLTWFVLVGATIVVAALATSIHASAQSPTQFRHFSGLINDHSPETTVTPTGPWEMHGTWQLTVQGSSGPANFSAQLTMELGDYSIVCCGIDPDSPSQRMPHTHTISLVGGQYTPLSGGGFDVTGGKLVINKNGSPVLPNSTLTIEVTGGTSVKYTNVQLIFTGDAAGHFGMQPVNGVVQKSYSSELRGG